MNDGFLYQSKPPLREGFSEALYARINRDLGQKQGVRELIRKFRSLRLAVRIAIFLITILSVTLLVSKEARAMLVYLIEEVGGFKFEETDQFPFSGLDMTDYQIVPQFELDRAQDQLTFSLTLPEYIPEGYTLTDGIGVACDFSCAILTWRNEKDDVLILNISHWEEPSPEWSEPVGFDVVEEIYINDTPAALIKGAWDFETEQWNEARAVRLKWMEDGLFYTLGWWPSDSGKRIEDRLSVDELIRAAQSIH